MKKGTFLFTLVIVLTFLFSACHKDIVDLTDVGIMHLKVSKGFISKNHNKGLWDSFSALIEIKYESGEVASYQCTLSDEDGDGFYSNSSDSQGEKLYIQSDKKFKVSIVAIVDGETASGESDWATFEGAEGNILEIEIKLMAGKNRIGIYPPRVAGDKVVATGEVVELIQGSNEGQVEVHECGFICMPSGAYQALTSEEDFKLDYQGDQSQWRVEFDYTMRETGGNSFSVLYEDLYPTTDYYIRGFAFIDTTVIYSRILNFKTEEKDTAELQIMFLDTISGANEMLTVSGMVAMNVYAPVTDITEVGVCVLPLESNVEFDPTTQVDNQIVVQGQVYEEQGVFGRGMVNVEFDKSQLEECVDYKMILYARYNNKTFFDHDYIQFGRSYASDIILSCQQVEILPEANTNGKAQIKATISGSVCRLSNVTEVGFECMVSYNDVSNEQLVAKRHAIPYVLEDSVYTTEVPIPADEVNLYYRAYYVLDGEYYYDNYEPNQYLLVPTIRPEFTSGIETHNASPYSLEVSYSINTNGLVCECGVMYYKVTQMEDMPTFDVNNSTIQRTSVGQTTGQVNFEIRNLSANSDYIICPYVVNEELTIAYPQIVTYGSTVGAGDEILENASDLYRYIIFYCGNDYSLAYINYSETATSSIIGNYRWGEEMNVNMQTIAPSADGVVNGTFNTNSIVQAYGEPTDVVYAAWECNNYTFTCEQGTFKTYLPTASELQKLLDFMATQDQTTNQVLRTIMNADGIWTSDQVSATQATAFIRNGQTGTLDFQQQAADKSQEYLTIPIFRY